MPSSSLTQKNIPVKPASYFFFSNNNNKQPTKLVTKQKTKTKKVLYGEKIMVNMIPTNQFITASYTINEAVCQFLRASVSCIRVHTFRQADKTNLFISVTIYERRTANEIKYIRTVGTVGTVNEIVIIIYHRVLSR